MKALWTDKKKPIAYKISMVVKHRGGTTLIKLYCL